MDTHKTAHASSVEQKCSRELTATCEISVCALVGTCFTTAFQSLSRAIPRCLASRPQALFVVFSSHQKPMKPENATAQRIFAIAACLITGIMAVCWHTETIAAGCKEPKASAT